MIKRALRLSAALSLVAAAITGFTGAAGATPGPGTYTKITTPSGTTYFHFDGSVGATNHLTIAGEASSDLDGTNVDILCIRYTPYGAQPQSVATGVPVSSGGFAVNANLGALMSNCRLRAIPTAVTVATDYLGSYSGPIFYASGMAVDTQGSTPYDYTAASGGGEGLGAMEDASHCGAALLATVRTPDMTLEGPVTQSCAFAVPEGNIRAANTPNASSIKVDGHNAYLPYAVHDYLVGTRALSSITQPKLTTTFTRLAGGNVRVTETAKLVRCSVSDTYAATLASCPAVVATGVEFSRVVDILPAAHELRLRDAYRSADGHAHTVSVQYQARRDAPDTGAAGFMFPGHSSFAPSHLDDVITGLGTKANTMFVRTDRFATEGDPDATTVGQTWSRGPARVRFSHTDLGLYAMEYGLSVPAGGTSYLGFAESEAPLTTDAKKLAAHAVGEMVSTPAISSPANGAVIHGHTTTVKGSVARGANGLPTSVVVNGHAAKLTKVSATKLTYTVTFTETFATHTIKVTAKDSAGNTKSRSITVKNVA